MSLYWIAILVAVILVVLGAFGEWLFGKAITPIVKPIEKDCEKLPKKTKIIWVVVLLIIAACAWIYGYSLPGMRR